jgi:hypothetical protein
MIRWTGPACFGLLAVAALPVAAADWDEIRPKRTGDYDERRSSGYCNVRLRVDDEVVVHLRAERIAFETLRGRRAVDEATECSQPMPVGGALANFRFRGVDGRGNVELIEQPGAGNNYTARVRVSDTKGGDQGYTFRVEWENRGGSTAGSAVTPGSTGWGTPSPSGWGGNAWSGWGGGSSFQPVTLSIAGRGSFTSESSGQRDLREARVQVQSSGDAVIEFRGQGNPAFTGWVNRVSGDECFVSIRRAGQTEADGEARILVRSGELDRVEIRGRLRNAGAYSVDFRR